MNIVISKLSNCCREGRNGLIFLYKKQDGSIDWKSDVTQYRCCLNEYVYMNKVEKKDFEFHKFKESVVSVSPKGK